MTPIARPLEGAIARGYPIALLLGTHSVPKKNYRNGFFIPKPPVRAMNGAFNDAWYILKERPYRRGRMRTGTPDYARVPQMNEESSYANISIPRESPIYGLEPFGQDEPMGETMDMPMADDVLEPIRQRQREQEPFNPFTAKPPSTPPPMRQEREEAPGGTEGMSRGPMRSRKRGDPAREPRFVRPGFRGPAMPMTDTSAESRMQ